MANSKPILTTKDLSVGYTNSGKKQVILENVNVTLQEGTLVCFMGPNGVGKSTLIRTICGNQKALAGDITIANQPLNDLNKSQLARLISVVLTDRINAGNLSVKELIALGRYPYLGWTVSFSKEDKDQIDQAIALTNTKDLVNKKVFELSDGQLQKVMIARALCQDTPIIILDEPTAHLDLNNRVEVINMLSDLAKKSGKTILMATHELDLALQSADRIWLAGAHQPIIDGFPEDLVLNGSIDSVFELKGFDLKTGRLEKQLGAGEVTLTGQGHNYLWTKNALERYGYNISENAEIQIEIQEKETVEWVLNKKDEHKASTLEELIKLIAN